MTKRRGIILALIALVAAGSTSAALALTSGSRAATTNGVPAGHVKGAASPTTTAPGLPGPVTSPAPPTTTPTTPPPSPRVTPPVPTTVVPPPPPVTRAPTTVPPPPPPVTPAPTTVPPPP